MVDNGNTHDGARIAIRLTRDQAKRFDEYVERLRSKSPGVRITTSDAARQLIERGLTETARTR